MKSKLLTALLGLVMAIPGTVFAQSADDQVPAPSDQGSMSQGPMDPGTRDQDTNQSYNTPAPEETNGVARVSLIHGDVSTQRGDNGIWSAAALNAPVLAGDRVSTGDQARTELQLDYANMFRLAEHSQANITQLTRSQIQIQLSRGMANYTVLKNSDADAEIDTPNVAIRTDRRESSFRVLVSADDRTEILVRRGEVDVTTPQGGTHVTAGQFITVEGIGDQVQYKIGEAPARDDWDQWNTDRDNMIRNSVSRRHTNDYYVGTEDLDAHGTWSEVPDYGPVWRPTVSDPDWAPYRDGRWVYEPYWGWTWVSYDDWGWAPYHYGRWMYVDGGWGWWPGPVYAEPYYRPIWAPAYVSFFGWGGGVGFGFGWGWGSVGWLPLGPCDYFHPWWGGWGGNTYITNINIYNYSRYNRGGFEPLHRGDRFSNVRLAQQDPHFRGGTTVSGGEFGKGRMTPHVMDHAQFQNARFTAGRVPMTPGRESFSASGRPAAPSTTRNVSQNQHFFSAHNGTATPARSFARGQSQILNASTNRPQGGSLGSRQGGSFGSRNDVTGPTNNGFRHFGQSAPNTIAQSRSTAPVNNSRPEPRSNSTWGSAPRPGNTVNSSPTREGSNGGGWQKFTPMPPRPTSPAIRPESTRQGQVGGGPSLRAPENRGSYGAPRSAVPENRGSFGSPRSSVPENRGSYGSPRSVAPENRSSYGFPRNTGPDSRGYRSGGYGSGGYGGSRPPLNMRQPIVTPRSNGGGYSGGPYGGGNRGGYSGGGARQAPSYGGGGGRSAPSYSGGGGHSAPSGGAPHGGGGSPHGNSGGGGGRHGR